jgi:hypothetical protein
VWLLDAHTESKVPDTATGTVEFVVVPSPSFPLAFAPQQYASSFVVAPHVWLNPAFTELNVSPPNTRVGTRVGTVFSVVVPSPSWPREFPPQQ